MPIYQYSCEGVGCPHCCNGIEVLQRLSDAPLENCAECGSAVHRVLSTASVISGQAHQLKESHVEKHGFTQYRRAGKGLYEKTAGKGPKFISGS